MNLIELAQASRNNNTPFLRAWCPSAAYHFEAASGYCSLALRGDSEELSKAAAELAEQNFATGQKLFALHRDRLCGRTA